jgi:hypothetical protein
MKKWYRKWFSDWWFEPFVKGLPERRYSKKARTPFGLLMAFLVAAFVCAVILIFAIIYGSTISWEPPK